MTAYEPVVEAYLRLVDAAAPGLVEGLYLVGSVALGDYRPGASDVDFIAVLSRPAPLPVLAAVHRRLPRRPYLDGAYVTSDDLRRDPALAAAGFGVHEGRAHRRDGGCDPVAWHTLAGDGVVVRGPAVADLGVWTDAAVLRSWTLDNLDTYWAPWLRRAARPLSPLGWIDWGVCWSVLGISRLHYTLATGRITSKTGAGEHALSVFGERRVIEEALRIRAGKRSTYRNPARRRREALDFLAEALAAAPG